MANLFAAWNGGSTFVAGAAEVVVELTPVRSHGLLEAPERSAKGRDGRWEFTLALVGGEFSLGFVW